MFSLSIESLDFDCGSDELFVFCPLPVIYWFVRMRIMGYFHRHIYMVDKKIHQVLFWTD